MMRKHMRSGQLHRRQFLGGSMALALTHPALASNTNLDLALVGGNFWTGNPLFPATDAIGIIGDRIAAVGGDAVRKLTSRKTQIIDIDGAFGMPAFIDNHTHFLKAALAISQPDLLNVSGPADFIARIGETARSHPGRWITGQSWDEQRMGGELPSRHWIDSVTPETPVAVPRTDLHLLLLNSLALRLAGITRDTPDPDGGVIDRDEHGEPTGILRDNAKTLVERVIPKPSAEHEESALRSAIDLCHANGVAQVHIPEIDWRAHEALRRSPVARDKGLRFYSMVPLEDWQKIAETVTEEGKGDLWVRWGGVKGLADGSLGSRTALFYDHYTDDMKTSGVRVIPHDELEAAVLAADKAGLHVSVHAIGDLANDDVLDIFQSVEKQNGQRDRRFRIEHAQHIRPNSIPRFAQQGVIASVQPYHAIDDGRWAVHRIGEDRLHGTYAFGALIRSGAHVTFGSDWPVAPMNPLMGIHAAIARQTIDGANPEGWLPDEKVTTEQAMTAYTLENAYAGFQEKITGQLTPGFLADITIMDRDITSVSVRDIPKTEIMKTIVGGKIRYGT
ncbi:amidohydrolase [Hyphococcus sp. DH-69]|uniref:amidohydrolase n=1 Tax=Hyphococcus formosus TaxID=3143534 RepID=UPI00398BA7B4